MVGQGTAGPLRRGRGYVDRREPADWLVGAFSSRARNTLTPGSIVFTVNEYVCLRFARGRGGRTVR